MYVWYCQQSLDSSCHAESLSLVDWISDTLSQGYVRGVQSGCSIDANDVFCSCTVGNCSSTLEQAERSHHATHEIDTFGALVYIAPENHPLM